MSLRVLLVDDHALVRHGLRLILDGDRDFEVVGEAGDGAHALELADRLPVDLAVVDITMPRMTGLQLLPLLRARRPGLPVVVLSMHDNERFVLEAVRGGASAYVLKSAVDRDLLDACRAAVRGDAFLHPAATRSMMAALRGETAPASADDPRLSPRELEVLKLIAEGHSSRAIAELLVISVKTVEGHRARMAEKLGTSDRVALTRYAIRTGLVEA
ncbi:response regulator [Conexibacter sp. W3-3-2]|uniref:DNA-binding response regulator n=1 Tax=Paraconexibacter algicola TaxID=2133960 RepID=A0A2T4UDL6_9ACTN|nr:MULTISPECIES: response regulator transcription factor [Solirubrobacterales]MTD43829.1 response regulator [Conexibacter sp. W3-3-2]PTL55593.1 DNA-binding response regulator [Paraconexibacter algicola]